MFVYQYNDIAVHSQVVTMAIRELGGLFDAAELCEPAPFECLNIFFLGSTKADVPSGLTTRHRYLKNSSELRLDIEFSRSLFGARSRRSRDFEPQKIRKVLASCIRDALQSATLRFGMDAEAFDLRVSKTLERFCEEAKTNS